MHCGYAPGRTRYGEQFHRAAYTLAAITGNVGIPGGNSGCSGGAKRRINGGMPFGPNPTGARVASNLLADVLARGKAGGYPADIKMIYSAFGNLLNQCAQRQQDGGRPGRRGVHRGPGPLRDPAGALRRHPAPGHHVLGAQRHAGAVERRRPLHVLHAPGHRARRRVPERPRHPGRPRRAPRDRGLQRQDGPGLAARVLRRAPRSTTSRPSARRAWRACPRPRTWWPSPRKSAIRSEHPFSTPSGKIEVYSMSIAANPDMYGLGAGPGHSHVDSARRARSAPPADAVQRQVARPDPFHPRQPGDPRRAPIGATCGSTPRTRRRAASSTASSCASSTTGAPRSSPRASPTASPAGWRP